MAIWIDEEKRADIYCDNDIHLLICHQCRRTLFLPQKYDPSCAALDIRVETHPLGILPGQETQTIHPSRVPSFESFNQRSIPCSSLHVIYSYSLSVSLIGPPVVPDLTKLVPVPEKGLVVPEIVLFVGYPSTGKTTFHNQGFEPVGYKHVN